MKQIIKLTLITVFYFALFMGIRYTINFEWAIMLSLAIIAGHTAHITTN